MVPLEELLGYQLERINEQASELAGSTEFFSGIKRFLPLRSFAEFEALPFMSAEDILRSGTDLVCVPQRAVTRIVSLASSGTNHVKRIYFTESDLSRTLKFFSEGMSQMCQKGDSAAIFLPGNSENGVSDLLKRSLEYIGVRAYIYGAVVDWREAGKFLREFSPHTVIGPPACIRRLALENPDSSPVNALLSADYLPKAVKESIRRIWGCEVFEHYGLTESCYGFSVDCTAHSGMHIRNDEFYVEITDPVSGAVLPPGREGIITFTTLRREAMPLLRYRTGDIGMISPKECPCGLLQPRLEYVRGRAEVLSRYPNIYELDEAVFSIDSVLDYEASFYNGTLTVSPVIVSGHDAGPATEAIRRKYPDIDVIIKPCSNLSAVRGAKRAIILAGQIGGAE